MNILSRIGFIVLLANIALPSYATTLASDIEEQLQQQDNVRVIVTLKSTSKKRERSNRLGDGNWLNIQDYIGEAQRKLAKDMGWRNFNDIVRFKRVPAMAKSITSNELKRLKESKHVEAVHLDRIHTLSLTKSMNSIGLNTIESSYNGGQGSTVAIVDSGIEIEHPFFQNRVLDGACYSIHKSCPNGKKSMLGNNAGAPCNAAHCDHGSHVAGIVAGKNRQMQGVAPKANLLAVNVFSTKGKKMIGAFNSDIMQGLEWVYENVEKYNVSVVNMSLGGGYFKRYCDSETPVKLIVELLEKKGVTTVVASGNEFHTDGIAAPGCISSVVSVGSIEPNGSVSSFSNSYKHLSIMAPGGEIYSSITGGKYDSKNGTSMAAPHVAGAVAVLKSAYPQATVSNIKSALAQGNKKSDSRNGIRTSYLNINNALSWLENNLTNDQTEKSRPQNPRSNRRVQPQRPTPQKPTPQKPMPVQKPKKKDKCKAKRIDGILIENKTDACEKKIEW
mgnify:CR=1 FL=1